jgi:hypothetical protein
MITQAPNSRFNINGVPSFTPNAKYMRAIRNVQSGDEVDDVNSYVVTPQTPWSAVFFAIAMWIYVSSIG